MTMGQLLCKLQPRLVRLLLEAGADKMQQWQMGQQRFTSSRCHHFLFYLYACVVPKLWALPVY